MSVARGAPVPSHGVPSSLQKRRTNPMYLLRSLVAVPDSRARPCEALRFTADGCCNQMGPEMSSGVRKGHERGVMEVGEGLQVRRRDSLKIMV